MFYKILESICKSILPMNLYLQLYPPQSTFQRLLDGLNQCREETDTLSDECKDATILLTLTCLAVATFGIVGIQVISRLVDKYRAIQERYERQPIKKGSYDIQLLVQT